MLNAQFRRYGLRAGLAAALLLSFAASALAQEPYKRSLYKHWTDADGDCQRTRQEVLIAESLEPVEMNEEGCRVVSGLWHDPFTDQDFTDPSKLDIDHLVPLKEAHLSGSHAWDADNREAYANDLSDARSLIAVSAGANRSKGAKDVANWLPPNEDHHCEYVANWISVKMRWGLAIDEAEAVAIADVLRSCEEG